MDRPLHGVRVLEVARSANVASAGAVLADWGADVIKVDTPDGDGRRGPRPAPGPVVAAPNRGKRSIGLGLGMAEARPVLDELIRRSDVFLTDHPATACAKLRIDLDEVRRVNPGIIYVTGSGCGTAGPDRDRGADEATAFWARGGSADGLTAPDAGHAAPTPSSGYGDNVAALAVAGGVAAALYGRRATGEPSVLDVSLLAVGAWANQFTVNSALAAGGPLPKLETRPQSLGNPLVGGYRTADGRFITLAMSQPARHWPEFCRLMGRDDCAFDPRFTAPDTLAEHIDEAVGIVATAIAARSFAECCRLLEPGTGAWAPVQDGWEVGNDEALIANGRIAEVVDARGGTQRLVANPVKFDDGRLRLGRAPSVAEHTEDVLREIGFDEDALTELKFAGAIS